jgi:transposase
MEPPIYVPSLTESEQQALQVALRASEAFALRRAQIILASARGLSPKPIAQQVGCSVQTVRNTIHAFEQEGVGCLKKQSNRPKSAQPQLDAGKCEQLKHLLHQSPRTFGKDTSLWTLALAAQVAHEQGLTEQTVSIETIRRALSRLSVGWRRAKHWISSPDPQYALKKSGVSD